MPGHPAKPKARAEAHRELPVHMPARPVRHKAADITLRDLPQHRDAERQPTAAWTDEANGVGGEGRVIEEAPVDDLPAGDVPGDEVPDDEVPDDDEPVDSEGRSSVYQAGNIIADKYELLGLIGRGGMGTVWRARNLVLDVEMAIKLVRRQVASQEASKRLLLEARTAAQLGHPSIVRVHDFGRTDRADPFIVMELLKGESLAEIIDRKGGLDAVPAVQMVLPVLAALAAAHGKGIVHRDIKPDNIILVADESGHVTPKLVDFGIAKYGLEPLPESGADEDEIETASRLARRLTQSGRLMGSPDYMSPEQASGEDVDARSDLWSMAVVLYEALVGAVPFYGDRTDELLLAILMADPPALREFGVGDESLWSALQRGLQKKVDERWQTAREMGQALAAWLLTQGIDTDITGASVREHWLGKGRTRGLSMPPPDGRRRGSGGDPDGIRATPAALRKITLPAPDDDELDTTEQEIFEDSVDEPSEPAPDAEDGELPSPAPDVEDDELPSPALEGPKTRGSGSVALWVVLAVLAIGAIVVLWARTGTDGAQAGDDATARPVPTDSTASEGHATAATPPETTAPPDTTAPSAKSPSSSAPTAATPGRRPGGSQTAPSRPPATGAPSPALTPTPSAKPTATPTPGSLPIPDTPNY